MEPTYHISINNQALSFQNRLISLHITDEIGFKSDTLELTLDDTDGQLALPQTGLKLDVAIGYKETGVIPMGQFVINEVSCEGPPTIMHIKAHAADFKQSLKTIAERSWHHTTIGDLVQTIAAKHGYTPKVSPMFTDTPIPHLDQTESDIHLLTRLAQQYGAIAKPAGGHLLFMPQNLAQSVSGQILTNQTINLKDVTHWSYALTERDNTEEMSQKNRTDEGQKINIHLTGQPFLRAEIPITLVGFRQGIPVDWIINNATHVLDGSGYHTTITGQRSLKGNP